MIDIKGLERTLSNFSIICVYNEKYFKDFTITIKAR